MHPTPNELELVIDFVNTRDIEKSTDALAGDGLREWLESRGLLDAPASHATQLASYSARGLRCGITKRGFIRKLFKPKKQSSAILCF